MPYLLDTNVASDLRKPRPHGAVVAWRQGTDDAQLFVSAVTLREIQAGIKRPREQDAAKAASLDGWLEQAANAYNVLPMAAAAFRAWARPMRRRCDTPCGHAMIAATATAHAHAHIHDHGLSAVTRHMADFKALGVTAVFNPFGLFGHLGKTRPPADRRPHFLEPLLMPAAPLHTATHARNPDALAAFHARTLAPSGLEQAAGGIVLDRDDAQIHPVRMPDAPAARARLTTPRVWREDTPIKPCLRIDGLSRVHALAQTTGGCLKPHEAAWLWRGQWHLDGCDPDGNIVQFRQRDAQPHA